MNEPSPPRDPTRSEGLFMKKVLFVIRLNLTTPPADPSARSRHFRRGERAPPAQPHHPPPRGGSRRGHTRNPQVAVITTDAFWAAGRPSPLESRSRPISRSRAVIGVPGVGAESHSASARERLQPGARGRPGGGHTSSPGTKRPPGPGAARPGPFPSPSLTAPPAPTTHRTLRPRLGSGLGAPPSRSSRTDGGSGPSPPRRLLKATAPPERAPSARRAAHSLYCNSAAKNRARRGAVGGAGPPPCDPAVPACTPAPGRAARRPVPASRVGLPPTPQGARAGPQNRPGLPPPPRPAHSPGSDPRCRGAEVKVGAEWEFVRPL